LDYFIRQGYPRELLFWLFADSFQFGAPGLQSIGYYYNPPVTYGCPHHALGREQICFKEWVLIAVLSGLTVEEKTIEKAGGSSSGRSGGSGKPSGGGDNSGASRGPETTIVPRFCFSPLEAHKAELEMGPQVAARVRALMTPLFNPNNAKPICGTAWNPQAQASQPQSDTFLLTPGPGLQFRIVPRSAYGVFEFLGQLMKVEQQGLQPEASAYIPPGKDYEAYPPLMRTTAPDTKLITVLQTTDERCFAHTWFYDGDYCVPESATNTKRIFSLLSQLIAIETTATDLSITPIVRIIE
jgi:hypothetical protein